jgi:hypothetical protein
MHAKEALSVILGALRVEDFENTEKHKGTQGLNGRIQR